MNPDIAVEEAVNPAQAPAPARGSGMKSERRGVDRA